MSSARSLLVVVAAISAVGVATAQTVVRPQTRAPNPAQSAPQAPTGAIIGTIIAAGAAHPLDGARVTLSGGGLRGSRSVQSGANGQFAFMNLPAGQYTLRASKPGYIAITYGQRSPAPGRPGTPIQLYDGQQIKDLQLAVPEGGVITGTVFDELSRPSVGTPVRLMRWSMEEGERELVSAGTATTDDRGVYRIYGLPPGRYLVAAMPRNASSGQSEWVVSAVEPTMQQQTGAALQRFTVVQRASPPAPAAGPEPATGYAPVYYPGTTQVSAAATIELGLSEERGATDLRLQRVPLARIDGRIAVPPGVTVNNVQIRLSDAVNDAPGVPTRSARSGRDGTFSFSQVPPGMYRLTANVSVRVPAPAATQGVPAAPPSSGRRGVSNTTQLRYWATADTVVSGEAVGGVTLALRPGMQVSGQVVFAGGTPPEDLRRVRVTLSPIGDGGSSVNASLDAAGRFTLSGVVPGRYRLRSSAASGWFAAEALVGGRDALDFPLEVQPDTPVNGIVLTMTNQSTELSGRLQDAMARPAPGYMVVAFPSDPRYWIPQARRIQAERPATDGTFAFRGLPPGEYRLAALNEIEPGAWYDPALLQSLMAASVPVTLASGERKMQVLQVR